MEHSKQARKPLSARSIELLRPGDVDRADTGENTGLRVSCGSTGARTFYYRYRSPETEKLTQLKIGNYPAVSLAQARLELARLKALRDTGVCPKAELERAQKLEQQKKDEEIRAAAVAKFTVSAMIELYLTEVIEDRMATDPRTGNKKLVRGARKPKGQSEARRTLYGDPVRVMGDRIAEDVSRKDVVTMIKAIIDRGANVQAGNVLREFSAAYEYSIGLDRFRDDFANPALLAKASLKMTKVRLTSSKGKRVLSDSELRQVLAWLPGSGFSTNQKNVMRLTLWTGCRTGEVCEAAWADIDLEKSVWHIPDSKNGTERDVQLPTQAVAFLRALKLNTEKYLFPSSRSGEPIKQKTLAEAKWHLKNPDKVKNGRLYRPQQLWLTSIPDWVPHDLRRTVRTGLSRLGCRSEVAEAVIGHSRKGIEGTYDLHKYQTECREWLQRWADHLDTLT